MSTMSDHQKVTVVPTEKIPFDQSPLPSKFSGLSEFTNLSIVQTVTTVSMVTVSSAGSLPPEATTLLPEGVVPPKVTTESRVSVPREAFAASAESVPLKTVESTESEPPEATTLLPEGAVPPKVTTESIVSVPREVFAASAESVPLKTFESTESEPSEVPSESIEGKTVESTENGPLEVAFESIESVPLKVTTLPPEGSVPPEVTTESTVSVPLEVSSESIESVPLEVTTLPQEGTVPPKVTTESTLSVPLEVSAAAAESVLLNTVESTESAPPEVTSESIESVPLEVTLLPLEGIAPPKLTTESIVSVPPEISTATCTESVPLNTMKSTKSAHSEVTSESIESIPREETILPPMGAVPPKVTTGSVESVLLDTVESTESAPPELTSEAIESVPPNATTLSLTSLRHESIVESTKSVRLEVTSESTGSGSSEVTTKPTEGVVPRDVTNSSIASAPSSNPPQLTPTANASAPSPGLTVAASSLTSGTPDDQELITKARDDAIHLNRAFAGWGCDEPTIVKILAPKSARQRTLIRQEYKTEFSEDFDNRLSKELVLRPDLKRALLLWMDEPANRDAKIVKDGLSKNVAIEVICSRTPSQLEKLKKAYHTLFGVYLDEDIESHAHGDNKKLLLAYAGTTRSESPEVDAAMVDKDAKDLFKDGEWRLGTNEETFIRIFSERSGAHLAAINSAYRKMYVNSLKKAVKRETSWKFKCALLTILQCAENPEKYFAKALHKAMAGLGTDDETLTRIIVSRAEVDIEKIKEEYRKKYGKPLSDVVHSDTSGHYRAFLISLLNPNA